MSLVTICHKGFESHFIALIFYAFFISNYLSYLTTKPQPLLSKVILMFILCFYKPLGFKWGNKITSAPLGDCLLGILFKYFGKNSWKFSSYYIIIFYIINMPKNIIKIYHLQILPLFKNIGYNVFKLFLGIFHSLDWFQTFNIYIPIHWK
jgi:hypothetical protein